MYACVCMCMCKVRPTKVEISEGQLLCVVCNDIGNGVHFGAVTCEGCKVRRLLCCENCPHSETKQFQNCFETVLFQFHVVVRTVLRDDDLARI